MMVYLLVEHFSLLDVYLYLMVFHLQFTVFIVHIRVDLLQLYVLSFNLMAPIY